MPLIGDPIPGTPSARFYGATATSLKKVEAEVRVRVNNFYDALIAQIQLEEEVVRLPPISPPVVIRIEQAAHALRVLRPLLETFILLFDSQRMDQWLRQIAFGAGKPPKKRSTGWFRSNRTGEVNKLYIRVPHA